MNWIVVTQDFPPGFSGGIASWVVDLGRALSDAGHPITVFARRTGNTQRRDDNHPFPVRRMWGRSWNRRQGLWVMGALWPHLRPGVRVLCANWPLATHIAPRLRGARLAVAVHGSDISRLRTAPPALSKLLPHVECFFPVSAFLANHLQHLCPSLSPKQVHVLPMPLPVPQMPSSVRRDELVVLSRLTPLKGIDRAVQIARRLSRPLCVIGDGPARDALLPLAGNGVTFAGGLPRSEALQRVEGAAGMLLLPRTAADGTGAEGLGLCLIEAAMRAVPGIGCRTGGVPEALGPGLLLSDPDQPDFARIEAFLNDPQQGLQARNWACAHHGPQRTVHVLQQAMP